MAKRDSKTRYAIKINVERANFVREDLGHGPISYEDMKTLAYKVVEIANCKSEGDYDYL